MEFWHYPSNIGILTIFLYTFEFWYYPSKHWISGRFLYTSFFWSSHSKQWNSGPIFIHIGFVILSSKMVEFWHYLYKHRNYCISKHGNCGHIYKDWNSDLILPTIWVLVLFLSTLKFWSYPSKHLNSGTSFINVGILT